ncbi:MAG: hypothetical protein ACLTYN_10660 [Dysosmobacter welbionis]
MGDNGSGKSTLLRACWGSSPPVRGDSPGAGTAAGSRGLSAPADPGPAGLPGHGV